MLSARNCEPQGASMSLESITQQIRKEISKLNQVLHLLEGGAKKTTRVGRKMSAAKKNRGGTEKKVGED